MALLITADDSIRKLSPQDLEGSRNNDGAFSLADMQQMVGGYIQAVMLNPVIVHDGIRYSWLVINEEGKLLSLPGNNNATLIAKSAIRPDDYIVGNALILEESEFQ
ncbi:TPA: DUF3846 domain-containing protein [Raoultella ornithinolytica]|nr:DUF3846 domain-containing protein [Raoultella ornithinolytica]